jgi:hypothetical protein
MMTTDTILEAAIAAFRTRYRDRPWVTWESQDEPVQLRWVRVAELTMDGAITSGREFREKYLDGLGAPDRDTDKEWTELGLDQRRLWNDAVTAIQRVAMEARAAA